MCQMETSVGSSNLIYLLISTWYICHVLPSHCNSGVNPQQRRLPCIHSIYLVYMYPCYSEKKLFSGVWKTKSYQVPTVFKRIIPYDVLRVSSLFILWYPCLFCEITHSLIGMSILTSAIREFSAHVLLGTRGSTLRVGNGCSNTGDRDPPLAQCGL